MRKEFYRYISADDEVDESRAERKIESVSDRSPFTWYTPTRYSDHGKAKEELAMPNEPHARAGPVTEQKLPRIVEGPQRVQPSFGEPGGGIEVKVRSPVWLFGLWDMQSDDWV